MCKAGGKRRRSVDKWVRERRGRKGRSQTSPSIHPVDCRGHAAHRVLNFTADQELQVRRAQVHERRCGGGAETGIRSRRRTGGTRGRGCRARGCAHLLEGSTHASGDEVFHGRGGGGRGRGGRGGSGTTSARRGGGCTRTRRRRLARASGGSSGGSVGSIGPVPVKKATRAPARAMPLAKVTDDAAAQGCPLQHKACNGRRPCCVGPWKPW